MPDIDNEPDVAIDPPDNQPGGGKADTSSTLSSEQAAAKIDPPSNDGGN